MRSLQRPLRDEEKRALWGDRAYGISPEMLDKLADALEKCDEEEREVIQACIQVLIYRKMEAYLFDRPDGAAYKCIESIEKTVDGFNRYLRVSEEQQVEGPAREPDANGPANKETRLIQEFFASSIRSGPAHHPIRSSTSSSRNTSPSFSRIHLKAKIANNSSVAATGGSGSLRDARHRSLRLSDVVAHARSIRIVFSTPARLGIVLWRVRGRLRTQVIPRSAKRIVV